MPIFGYQGKFPLIHEGALISPLATIVGDVEIFEESSVFPGVVIRGDVAKIMIGRYTNIQENVVIHGGDIWEGDDLKGHIPVKIGDYVTVAHGAIVDGSKIEDVTIVGVKAIVFDGSTIGEGSIVGMGAVVLENTKIPKRSIVVGVPAKIIKTVDDITYSRIKKQAIWYNQLAKSHKELFLKRRY